MYKEYDDYRMIVYKNEFQNVMQKHNKCHEFFGNDYADVLLAKILRVDYRILTRVINSFTNGQKILYALYAFNAEVMNGGIAQFFFNSEKEIIPEVLKAFHSLKLYEYAKRYSIELNYFLENEGDLDELHKEAISSLDWSKFQEYRSVLKEQSKNLEPFDDWYIDKENEESELDKVIREYIVANQDEYVVFCDEDEAIEKQKVIDAIDEFTYIAESYLENKYVRRRMGELFNPSAFGVFRKSSWLKNLIAKRVICGRLNLLNRAIENSNLIEVSKENGILSAVISGKTGLLGKKSLNLSLLKKGWLVTDWS